MKTSDNPRSSAESNNYQTLKNIGWGSVHLFGGGNVCSVLARLLGITDILAQGNADTFYTVNLVFIILGTVSSVKIFRAIRASKSDDPSGFYILIGIVYIVGLIIAGKNP